MNIKSKGASSLYKKEEEMFDTNIASHWLSSNTPHGMKVHRLL